MAIEKLLEIILEKWDKVVRLLKRWCLSRWYFGWSNRWHFALLMLPCRFVHISDERVREEYERARSLVHMCERSFDDLCGFFIALIVAVARAQGFDIGYFKARYRRYCEEMYKAKLPGRYVMCRALGVGRLKEVEKKLRHISKKQEEDVGYYVELVKLALGIRDIYNVDEAYCVPFAHVSGHNGGGGKANEGSRKPITQVVEACRRLKAAVEKVVS